MERIGIAYANYSTLIKARHLDQSYAHVQKNLVGLSSTTNPKGHHPISYSSYL